MNCFKFYTKILSAQETIFERKQIISNSILKPSVLDEIFSWLESMYFVVFVNLIVKTSTFFALESLRLDWIMVKCEKCKVILTFMDVIEQYKSLKVSRFPTRANLDSRNFPSLLTAATFDGCEDFNKFCDLSN